MTQDIREAIQQLADSDAARRRRAAETLLAMGSQAQSAAASLVRATADTDEIVREAVVGTLESLGAPAAQDIVELTNLLSSEFTDTAYWAATLLGRAGISASSSVDAMARVLMASSVPEVRQRIAWALGLIKSPTPEAVRALEDASVSGDSRLERISRQSLEQIRTGP
jgi:HEAT repeat protein